MHTPAAALPDECVTAQSPSLATVTGAASECTGEFPVAVVPAWGVTR